VRTVAGRVGHGGGGATTLKYYAAFLLVFTSQGAEALCGQCEVAVQARPNAEVGPIGRTIKVEPAPPRELAPWETIAQELAAAIKDGTTLPGEDVPTVGDIVQPLPSPYALSPRLASRSSIGRIGAMSRRVQAMRFSSPRPGWASSAPEAPRSRRRAAASSRGLGR